MRRAWFVAPIFALALVMVAVTGACSQKSTEPFRDGPRSGVVNRNSSDLIENPDGFSNASTKCDHGNRLYFAYKGDENRAAIAISPQDPSCKGS